MLYIDVIIYVLLALRRSVRGHSPSYLSPYLLSPVVLFVSLQQRNRALQPLGTAKAAHKSIRILTPRAAHTVKMFAINFGIRGVFFLFSSGFVNANSRLKMCGVIYERQMGEFRHCVLSRSRSVSAFMGLNALFPIFLIAPPPSLPLLRTRTNSRGDPFDSTRARDEETCPRNRTVCASFV